MIIVDTGPVVAFLNPEDSHHSWAVKQFNELHTPFLTCDGLLIEAAYLLGSTKGKVQLLKLVASDALMMGFSIQQEADTLLKFIDKYGDLPIDLVDACIVRMSELYPEAEVLTIDSDFHIYRRNRNQRIPLIMPD